MIETIVSAIVVYVSTSIDYLIILMAVFAQARSAASRRWIVGGHYAGTALLFVASLLAAFVVHRVPEEWAVGLLGLVPILLGIRAALAREEDDEADELAERTTGRSSLGLFWTMALVTIASGGDNLGIYIPYFATLDAGELTLVAVVFAVMIALLCYASIKLLDIPSVSETLERYERVVLPVVFIGLGIFILAEAGTIRHVLGLLSS